MFEDRKGKYLAFGKTQQLKAEYKSKLNLAMNKILHWKL